MPTSKLRYFTVYSRDINQVLKVTGVDNLARLLDIPLRQVPKSFMLKVAFGEGADEKIVVEQHGP